MVGGNVAVRLGDSRVSIGNASLDAMLEGGLVARRPYLIVGPSGTGKTTLALQFLCEGVRRHEKVLLVTLEEPPNEARINHRGLEPHLNEVDVFDAIPDIMRYERAPFKDIASVRSAVPFSEVPFRIRRSPELASVEVTITALEQMLRTEVIRKGYTRLVIDSLTALQYFCMKGFDPVAGAQSFLRFLSDLRVTTLLTVEAPLEDIETPERMLARGEIRLFRWELDDQTVRAVGVEKFRGSSHDVRLHPYRIGPRGLDINLEVTISRDTRMIIEPIVPHLHPPTAVAPVLPAVSPVTPLVEEVRDLILLGADVAPARTEIEAALAATSEGRLDEAQAHLSRVSSLVLGLVDRVSRDAHPLVRDQVGASAALQRVLSRVDSFRAGAPPTSLPPPAVLQVQLGALLSLLPAPTPVAEAAAAPPAPAVAEGPPEVLPEEPIRIPESEPTPPHPMAREPVTPPLPVTSAPSSSGPQLAAAGAHPSAPPGLPTPTGSPAPSGPEGSPSGSLPPTHAAPHPGRGSRGGVGKGGPSPPKPSPRVGRQRPEPPPLPTSVAGEWYAPVPPPPTAAVPPAPTTPPAVAEPAVPAPPHGHPAAGTIGRKRRKPATGVSKKPAAHLRNPPAHEAEGPSLPSAPAPPIVPAGEALPVSTEPPPSPATDEQQVAKPRRRAPRKRKAPPVVSVTVEPIPPGVFGSPEVPPSTTERPEEDRAPEDP
ncbi:MAG TPA: ATPase domain-containing protein [Thermoplasmata archaeon]|nr:ATPase domain-containing protein [Thermoplasmata archaeon]